VIALQNYQWELDGVAFGADCPVDHEADSEPSSYSWRSQDTSNPSRDGMTPGKDLIEPGAWNFKLFTNCESEGEALDALQDLATVWRGDSVRKTPGAVLPLRYRLNSRTRRVYGRPRRFTAPLGPTLTGGAIMITSDFQTVSEMYFDDIEQSITVGRVAPATGGLLPPLASPLSTQLSSATRPNTVTIGGALPTPFWVEFAGPSTDAFLDIDGIRVIQIRGDIGAESITVDARPWIMSAYRADGTGMAHLLHPRFRLPGLELKPGSHQFTYGAVDFTGSSSAKVSWRGAYPSV
jgi:hypothetical protein